MLLMEKKIRLNQKILTKLKETKNTEKRKQKQNRRHLRQKKNVQTNPSDEQSHKTGFLLNMSSFSRLFSGKFPCLFCRGRWDFRPLGKSKSTSIVSTS